MKKFAFTLSEVLLVISIIGVVAALTLPNLSRDTNDAEIVAKVKKAYSILNTAVGEAQEKYGEDISTWYSASDSDDEKAEIFGKRLLNYLSASKICEFEDNSDCFSNISMASINGGLLDAIGSNKNIYKFILNDGMSIGVSPSTLGAINFYIDIDGPKGYNKLGQDIFVFAVDFDGRFVNNYSSATPANCRDGSSDVALVSCAEWVLKNSNADYIKCDDLSAAKITCN